MGAWGQAATPLAAYAAWPRLWAALTYEMVPKMLLQCSLQTRPAPVLLDQLQIAGVMAKADMTLS